MLNVNGKMFRSIHNTSNGEVSGETVFHYYQHDNLVWATYNGGSIFNGHLIAKMNEEGILEMKYHHLNTNGELMTGECQSTPQLLPDGRIRLHERWKWTSGDCSSGTSMIEEIK